jgi:hypothetical protein
MKLALPKPTQKEPHFAPKDHILHRMLWILISHGFGLRLSGLSGLSGERCKSWGTTMWDPQQPGLIDFCIFLPDPLLAVVAECTLISTNSCFEATGHFFKFCGCTHAFWFRRKCQGRELWPNWTPLNSIAACVSTPHSKKVEISWVTPWVPVPFLWNVEIGEVWNLWHWLPGRHQHVWHQVRPAVNF